MRRYYLKLLGSDAPRLRMDTGKVYTVGRDPKADLPLPESFLTSKRHAEIEAKGDRLLVSAAGIGGVMLNGKRIAAQTTARAGDQLQIGSAFILVEEEVGAEAATAASAPAA